MFTLIVRSWLLLLLLVSGSLAGQRLDLKSYVAAQQAVLAGAPMDGVYKRYQRTLDVLKRHQDPDGFVPNFVQANWAAHRQLQTWTGPVSGNWQAVGPANTYAANDREGLGRVNCIAFESANVWYVGTAGGGLWRGENVASWFPGTPYPWTPLTDNLPVPSISGIVVHPSDPNEIWILTGDGDGRDTPGVGILKSNDRGVTWNPTDLVWNREDVEYGYKLIAHPTNPLIQFAATTEGLYRTADGWASKTLVYSGGIAFDVEFKPGDPSIMYLGASLNMSSNSADLLQSTDGGFNFPSIAGNLAPSTPGQRVAVAVSADNPSRVYVMIAQDRNGSGGGLATIQRSDNDGASFTQVVNSSNNLLARLDPLTTTAGQGNYDLALWSDPNDADVVLVGGVDLYKGSGGGIFWTHLADDAGDPPNYIHADIHALETNPFNGNLCAGTDGGIWQSGNNGNTWYDMGTGLAITQFYHLNTYHNFLGIVEHTAGSQDNGTFANPGSGDLFTKVKGSDGFRAFRGYPDGDRVRYVETQNGQIFVQEIIDPDQPDFVAEDEITPSSNSVWDTPYQPSPSNHNILVAGYEGLYLSQNRGDDWAFLFSSLYPTSSNIMEMDWSESNTNYFSFYNDSRKLVTCKLFLLALITSDLDDCQCKEHSLSVIADTANLNLSDMTHSGVNPDEMAVCLSGYADGKKVFRNSNTDSLGTWENISYNLPNVPVNTIEWDVDGYYIGTDVGVFFLNHGDNVWLYHSENLPTVPVRQIEIVEDLFSKRIFVATYGRGVWVGEPAPPNRRTRWYVKESAIGANDGTSWANAFTDLQDALDIAISGDSVWVGLGTYKPSSGSISISSDPSSRQKNFHLESPNVRILGGFFGTEDDVTQRLPDVWRATLSGDLGVAGDSSDNAYHVFAFTGRNENVVLDGFIIRDGNANGTTTNRNGAGVYYSDVNVTGGMPFLRNLSITGNAAVYGAGMYIEKAGNVGRLFSINNLDIINNRTTITGAAMYIDNGPATTTGFLNIRLDDCRINNNQIANSGGAFHIVSNNNSSLALEINNSEISHNRQSVVTRDGAGFYVNLDNGGSADITLTNTEFKDNTSVRTGAAFFAELDDDGQLELTVTDCLFEDNSASTGPAIHVHSASSAATFYGILQSCDMVNNTSTLSGGAALRVETGGSLSNMDISDCSFSGNTSNAFGGAISFSTLSGLMAIDSSTFASNQASYGGALHWGSINGGNAQCDISNTSFFYNSANYGGALFGRTGNYDIGLNIDNAVFFSNSSSVSGGAISAEGYSGALTTAISNSTFSNNLATSNGGSIYTWGGNLYLDQVDFASDSAGNYGGSIYFYCNSADSLCALDYQIGKMEYGGARNGGAMCIRSFGTSRFESNVEDVEFTSNRASSVGGAVYTDQGSLVDSRYSECLFQGNTSNQDGGAMYFFGSSIGTTLDVSSTKFLDNTAGNTGGAIHYASFSDQALSFTDVDFVGNASSTNGGAVWLKAGGGSQQSAVFRRALFDGNEAIQKGGALAAETGSNTPLDLLVSTSVLLNNHADQGGGLSLVTTSGSGSIDAHLDFITAYNNQASSQGGLAYLDAVFAATPPINLTISNSLLKANSDPSIDSTQREVYLDDYSAGSAKYSIFEHGIPFGFIDSGNNLVANPILVHPTDPAGANMSFGDTDDGLMFATGSPALDAADPTAPIQSDFKGLLRFSSPDIGAYEGGDPQCFNDVAPDNLVSTVSPAGVSLNWEPIGNTVACRVSGRPLGAPSFASLNAIGLNKLSAFVPASKLSPTTDYEWSVLCACSITPLNLTPTSALDTFFFPGTAARLSQESVRIEVLPNPATDYATLLVRSDRMHEVQSKGVFHWEQLTTSGQVLRSGQLHLNPSGSAEMTIELSELLAGVYSIVVFSPDNESNLGPKWSLQLIKH